MSSNKGSLKGKTIVLGVTGGIAVYKACDLFSCLNKAEAQVHGIMTRNACEFVSPLTFQTLSGNPVAQDTFENPQYWEVEHIALAKKADLFVIAPATANVIAKLAHGLADDMLTTTILATTAPLLIAPAMNTQMYQAQATQQNLKTLVDRGVYTAGPEGGLLACGDIGAGRMSEPADILAACEGILAPGGDYAGLRAVVTAGPTREALDPVRFLTNKSSGRMGYAIAQALAARGAEVVLISGPVSLSAPQGVELVPVESTEDLYQAVMDKAPHCDVLIQAAAPADFTAARQSDSKIKKQGDEDLTLRLRQTRDVAKAAGEQKKPHQVFVGFAAETGGDMRQVEEKRKRKNLDLICYNDVSQPGAGFDVDTNILTLIAFDQSRELPLMSKRQAADMLLDEILRLKKAKQA